MNIRILGEKDVERNKKEENCVLLIYWEDRQNLFTVLLVEHFGDCQVDSAEAADNSFNARCSFHYCIARKLCCYQHEEEESQT